jgi:hypothetical protein
MEERLWNRIHSGLGKKEDGRWTEDNRMRRMRVGLEKWQFREDIEGGLEWGQRGEVHM